MVIGGEEEEIVQQQQQEQVVETNTQEAQQEQVVDVVVDRKVLVNTKEDGDDVDAATASLYAFMENYNEKYGQKEVDKVVVVENEVVDEEVVVGEVVVGEVVVGEVVVDEVVDEVVEGEKAVEDKVERDTNVGAGQTVAESELQDVVVEIDAIPDYLLEDPLVPVQQQHQQQQQQQQQPSYFTMDRKHRWKCVVEGCTVNTTYKIKSSLNQHLHNHHPEIAAIAIDARKTTNVNKAKADRVAKSELILRVLETGQIPNFAPPTQQQSAQDILLIEDVKSAEEEVGLILEAIKDTPALDTNR